MLLAVVFLDKSSTLIDLLLYQLSGLMVVFMALGMIWAVMALLGAFFRRVEEVRAEARAASAPPHAAVLAAPTPVSALPDPDAIPPHILAVVTAAVYEMVGPAAVIRSVEVAPPSPTWSMEGRRQIFQSHRVR